jgi:hypothetical protein
MFRSVIWDVQRIKYALNTQYAYNTIVILSNFGSADFRRRMDLVRPKITQYVSKSIL